MVFSTVENPITFFAIKIICDGLGLRNNSFVHSHTTLFQTLGKYFVFLKVWGILPKFKLHPVSIVTHSAK